MTNTHIFTQFIYVKDEEIILETFSPFRFWRMMSFGNLNRTFNYI